MLNSITFCGLTFSSTLLLQRCSEEVFAATQKSGRISAVLPPESCGTNKNTTPPVSYCAVWSVSGCGCNTLPSQRVLVTMTIVIVTFIYLLLSETRVTVSWFTKFYSEQSGSDVLWSICVPWWSQHLCSASSWDPFGYVTSFTSILQAFYPCPWNHSDLFTVNLMFWGQVFEDTQPSLVFEIELVWRWGSIKRVSLSVCARTIYDDAKS